MPRTRHSRCSLLRQELDELVASMCKALNGSKRLLLLYALRYGRYTVSELCRTYGISRKTGYKWIDRFMARCELADRSSRPHRSPRAVAEWIEDAIVRARRQKPR